MLLKGMNKSRGKDFFRFHLVAGHVKGQGKGSMAVAFVDVPLLLLAGLFGSLGDNEIRFCGELTLKIEQSYPASSANEITLTR